MQRIVAATDFSSRSDRAIKRAGLLARQFGSELILTHIVDEDQPESLVDIETREALRLLKEQIGALPELGGLDCRVEVITGDPFSGILHVAETVSADLIVMGSHRKQLLRDVFVGTTLERVMRTGRRPVLLVNRTEQRPYRSVIAAVDISEASARAVKVAKSLGFLNNVTVTFLHAFFAPAKTQLFVGDAPQDQIESYVESERRKAAEELVAFLERYKLDDKGSDYRIEEGDAVDVITRAVDELRSDLLVVGTHGRTGISKLLLGSVAEAVACKIDVDILVVPAASN